ncbi:hypothetical protein QYE76_070010 [Lolium multiflorum]|uniref:Uncharacterized protein n=1 Tax=Lolium multiflorum TaxID=4521 RepID=A0AAD8WE25_LOLMU|nr:hypothetical protein QYE76_070010 [Lolium multiflorum]
MTESVLDMIMFAATSHEVWETLASAFASTSHVGSSAIRQEMADLKKENKTINAYFHQMTTFVNSLTSIGMPLRDDEFIGTILASNESWPLSSANWRNAALKEAASTSGHGQPVPDGPARKSQPGPGRACTSGGARA